MPKTGFRINYISISGADNGQLIWRSNDGEEFHSDSHEIEATLPKSILSMEGFTREINFSTDSKITNLRLEQTVLMNENPEEFFEFQFGFVIPGSTNTWQQTILTDFDGQPIPAELLSGNVVVLTKFLDGEKLVASSRVKIFYV